MKNLGFILIGGLAAILSALATVYFLLNSSYFNELVLKNSHTENVATPPVYIKFDNLVTNLKKTDDDVEHYVSLGLTLKVVNQEAQDAITPYAPLLKNDALMLMSSKSYDEIVSQKEITQKQLLQKMNDDLVKEGVKYTLSDVLFVSFVVQ